MNHLARLVLVALVVAVTAAGATAQDSATRLLGLWREFSPGDNLIEFTGGKFLRYLRKGEIGDRRLLEGDWQLSADGSISMRFTLEGRTFSQRGTLTFAGDEMVLTDRQGNATRHRRHSGPLPDWAQW
jgi:hypothetical protein